MFQELFYLRVDAMPTPELMCKAPEEGVGGPTGESTGVPAPLFLCPYCLEAGSSSTSPSRWMRLEFVPLLSGVHPCNAMANAVVQASDTGG